jgi:putative nucleotidyltransferase with HDIG domain
MQQILPLELVGHEKLDFDLYDDKGQMVYQCGENLTPDLLIKLSYKKIFVKKVTDENLEPFVKLENFVTPKQHLISEKATINLVKNAKTILKKVYDNEKLDTATFIESTDIIVEEVRNNLEKIDCISQLRIFDEYTFSHTVNVSTMSSALGIILKLKDHEIKELTLGALLHDIGKMLVPKDILNKPAKLEPEEFEIMKSHTLLGYRYIVENFDVADNIARVALDHQEKYEGGGYPNGLKGKEINLYAQVASIADVYDALISNRVYKRAFKSEEAIEIMLAEGSKSFNPYMLSKFLEITDYKNKDSFKPQT